VIWKSDLPKDPLSNVLLMAPIGRVGRVSSVLEYPLLGYPLFEVPPLNLPGRIRRSPPPTDPSNAFGTTAAVKHWPVEGVLIIAGLAVTG